MHVRITDQNGMQSVICFERETGTAIVLRGHPDHLERAVALAEAEKAPHLRIIVDPENTPLLEALEDEGWVLTPLLVYERTRNNR